MKDWQIHTGPSSHPEPPGTGPLAEKPGVVPSSMRNPETYQVITAATATGLEAAVETAIEEKWTPTGGVSCLEVAGKQTWIQAVTRTRTNSL